MDDKRMKRMLKEGYTPEYVSLVKWQELRLEVLNGKKSSVGGQDIGSSTCALCETVKPTSSGSCRKCSLYRLFKEDTNLSCTKPWRQVNESDVSQLLASITNMVNYLQLLVIIYGVKKKEEEEE